MDRTTPSLRLEIGRVTALLGPRPARRAVLAALDGGSARCGQQAGGVRRVTCGSTDPAGARIAAVRALADDRLGGVVLVDHLTDGLAAAERRTVLAELRVLAGSGTAVLVDDEDPVAALAAADGALRVGSDGALVVTDSRDALARL